MSTTTQTVPAPRSHPRDTRAFERVRQKLIIVRYHSFRPAMDAPVSTSVPADTLTPGSVVDTAEALTEMGGTVRAQPG
ncbi:hypothetical protein BJ982_000606 [Sphaerisporangium siamense]|uniref:Uncharacterized protein n=1 Tax=Sphaerisporangium siamense TaxID=795645 RepID=A0A7W7D2H5_9ACTN|nr:hypothetical protein [Sphaerisporangium siamense]